MSFFGFDQNNDLEEEKRRILERGANGDQEGLAVYTWGEESYDGLGDALQEGGDELNDETFGGSGAVGKDFDFAAQALPTDDLPGVPAAQQHLQHREPSQPQYQQRQESPQVHQPRAAARPVQSLEAIWDNKSPFSVLPKQNGASPAPAPPPQQRIPDQHAQGPSSGFSPFDLELEQQTLQPRQQQPITLSLGTNQTHGVRTLEEIEAEMREAFAAQRLQNQSPSQAQLLHQAQLRNVQRHAPQHFPPGSTPPPRMHAHAQSPRFQQQQQQQHHQLLLQQQQQQMQLLELQELRERQQRQQLLELQEQLRLEEIERARHQQLRAQQNAQYLQHQRQQSGGTPLGEGQYRRHGQRVGTPSRLQQQQLQQQQLEVPFQQNLQYLPREIQMQQKLLAEMAQAEFLHSLQGSPVNPAEDKELQEQLRAEAMRKIMEAERMEEKRKRKLEKIRYMSRYNDLMTQSDKDFITRIQVSQLVTQDPFSDDFYAQVFGRLLHSRLGVNAPEAVLKFGSGGGVGLGLGQVKGGRRQSAMQRMEQQVERIVNNARLREKEKTTLNNLQGALGKTAGRSYKAAPRQLLQVDSGSGNGTDAPNPAHAHISKADVVPGAEGEGAAQKAAEIGHEALQGHGKLFEKKDPLTHRETLVILERIFDIIMELDRLKEDQPPPESEAELLEREERFTATASRLYDALRVSVPLETSVPHPFISLITPVKGKKMFPRALRYIDQSRHLTIMTLILACFSQLDVVKNSVILDQIEESPERKEAEKQLDAFIHHVMHALLPVAATAGVRLIRGLLGVLMTRNDIGAVARTRPGIFILTLFISRIEQLSQEGWAFSDDAPTPEDIAEWHDLFNQLFTVLSPHLLFLFPSVRQAVTNNIPLANVPDSDDADQPVWQFLAILAAHAAVEQQQILVSAVKERVLESVASANKGYGIANEEQRVKRLANVNIFLHALGLDSSQIAS